MRRRMMKSKIHRATVTDADLHYVGLDHASTRELMDAGRHPRARAGRRRSTSTTAPGFETYVIEGARAGDICLNGAAARLVQPGDRVIVITYADYEDAELDGYRAHGRPRRHRQPARRRGTRPPSRAEAGRPAPLRRGLLRRRWRRPVRSTPPLDLLVLGSGVAGLSAAVRAAEAPGLRVGVLTKGELHQADHPLGPGRRRRRARRADPDSTDLHLADTLAAGAGLCDVDAVRVLVDEGPDRVTRADRPRRGLRP